MKNKLMKMQFLLLLTTVVVVQSFAQSNSIKINKEHPRLILSNADIDLMRGNALSGIEPWKTAWENLKMRLMVMRMKNGKRKFIGEMSACHFIMLQYVMDQRLVI